LPPSEVCVLAYGYFRAGSGWEMPEVYTHDGKRWRDYDGMADDSVTHWCEIPDLPTEAS
jgi:hypothetical protein